VTLGTVSLDPDAAAADDRDPPRSARSQGRSG
jgi:hypothetical protein